MAELNFDLLRPQPTAGASFVSGMMEGQQDARTARTQDLQNQVSQLNLAKLRRDQESNDRIVAAAQAHGGPGNKRAVIDAFLSSNDPTHVALGVKMQTAEDNAAAFDRIMNGDKTPATPVTPPTSFAAPTGAPEAATTTPLPNPTLPTEMPLAAGQNPPAINNLAPVAMGSNNLAPLGAVPVAPPAVPTNALAPQNISALIEKRNKLIALGTTQSIAAARALDADIALASKVNTAAPGSAILDSQGRIVGNVPEATSADIRTMKDLGYPITQAGYASFREAQRNPTAPPSMVGEYNFAKTPEGGNFNGTFQQFVTARAVAGRAPVQPSAPVAVVDPLTGKQIYVSREDAIRGGMTPAAAMESIAPKEIQKREAAFPAATSAIKGFETKSDSFVKDLETLRDHPGLSSITGLVAGRLPGATAEGRAAQAVYDKIVAKGGFEALQGLRDASKTGGALGGVSNQEGKQLTASFAAIDRRQNADDVKKAINVAISDIQGAKTRTREAYDSTYAYKSEKPNAPAAAPKSNAPAPKGSAYSNMSDADIKKQLGL